jgi:alkylation response protein AidB-like acyl-CoA dehydrogenase
MNGGAEFNEVFFDHAAVAAADVGGLPGDGWRIAMALLGFERGLSTLGQQMQFSRELDWIVDAAREGGVAQEPMFRHRIARAWAGLRVMRFNALRMLTGADGTSAAGAGPRGVDLQLLVELAAALDQSAMDMLDPDANVVDLSNETRTRLQNLFLFSGADTIYVGTNEIQLTIMAKRGLGMPKEPRGPF